MSVNFVTSYGFLEHFRWKIDLLPSVFVKTVNNDNVLLHNVVLLCLCRYSAVLVVCICVDIGCVVFTVSMRWAAFL